mmetsp:Transcript_0/g.1  ORF Transcript_0/g.1 Transcript_0/m.1 type:complete len:674 (-) Transcript_0:72-2093(-)
MATKSTKIFSLLQVVVGYYIHQYSSTSSSFPLLVDAFILPSPSLRSIYSPVKSQIFQSATSKSSSSKSDTLPPDDREDNNDDTDRSASQNAKSEQKQKKQPVVSNTKLQRLRDRMWVREALEDLTAAEFACKLTPSSSMDLENLLTKLDKRVDDMCIKTTYGGSTNCIVKYPVDKSVMSNAYPEDEDECWSLLHNFGMGSMTYTDDQRSSLVLRLLESRGELIKAMNREKIDKSSSSSSSQSSSKKTKSAEKTSMSSLEDLDQIREKLQTPDVILLEEDMKAKSSGPYVYVREDGTVDWDGALQDRAALKSFGTSVWARINGQDPDTIDEDSMQEASHGTENKVTAKIVETQAIKEKKEILDTLQTELKCMEKNHTALLNSAVSAGSAVANVNLAIVEPELRSKIRASDNELERKKDEVSFQTLNYELERIYTYLDGELGNTDTKGYIPLQDRLNVAEFGLLESQIESMNNQINSGGVVDSDVLAVVLDQTTDFKRRLGIDYYVTGLTFDQEAIKIWLNDLLIKSKKGLAFYGTGCQLFVNDLVFSSALIGRALTGYTLKPREVRTLRRTFKDVITFIPVVIILIIPLTPVGHVFVFGAIQRFYPDFFPSCFTERRQNLLALYETTEYSAFTIDENWQEKLVRILEAAGYFIVDNAKKLFTEGTDGEDSKNKT